ncbi:SufB/SufD family protein [Allosphingosinicella sp.]|uniref:SufB/SufD family protein n=1 Tax=Allosphingosinicella sp. TaxID=2823234 RepID=UPI0037837C66
MSTLALPSRREEAWRWSDPGEIEAARALVRPQVPIDMAALWLPVAGPRLVFVDGRYDPATSAADGFALGTATLTTAHPLGMLANGIGSELRLGADSALHVQIVHVTTGGEDQLPLSIVLEAGAAVGITETFVGTGWANRLTRITLDHSARLMRAVRLSQEAGFVSLRDEAEVGTGASYVSNVLAVGPMSSRIDGEIVLAGEEAFAEVSGALLARGRQRHDVNLVLRHAVPNGTSRQVWRSVADDQATCSVAARVEVARDAQKTDGEQSLKGLLLARSAVINAKPELEIFADDVKCAHGATVGELDRNALFYLESRGIGPDEAKGLLTRAFVADALDRIGEEEVKKAFYADAERWFSPLPLGDCGGSLARPGDEPAAAMEGPAREAGGRVRA